MTNIFDTEKSSKKFAGPGTSLPGIAAGIQGTAAGMQTTGTVSGAGTGPGPGPGPGILTGNRRSSVLTLGDGTEAFTPRKSWTGLFISLGVVAALVTIGEFVIMRENPSSINYSNNPNGSIRLTPSPSPSLSPSLTPSLSPGLNPSQVQISNRLRSLKNNIRGPDIIDAGLEPQEIDFIHINDMN
jgi:hypothetical protein